MGSYTNRKTNCYTLTHTHETKKRIKKSPVAREIPTNENFVCSQTLTDDVFCLQKNRRFYFVVCIKRHQYNYELHTQILVWFLMCCAYLDLCSFQPERVFHRLCSYQFVLTSPMWKNTRIYFYWRYVFFRKKMITIV